MTPTAIPAPVQEQVAPELLGRCAPLRATMQWPRIVYVHADGGPYTCVECEVAGVGDVCWLCGSAEHLVAKLTTCSSQDQSFWTIEELLSEESDSDIAMPSWCTQNVSAAV